MRILHVADTHLGTRQYGLDARRRDFAAAFRQTVDRALEHGVDGIVHAGDLFNDRSPLMEDLTDVVRELGRLRDAGIPFLGVVGNHEGKRGLQWLDLFEHLGLAVHLRDDTPYEVEGVPFWGRDFCGRRAGEVAPPEVRGGVLVMHQMLDQVAYIQGELKLADLAACGAEVVLLGDNHEHEVWREGGVLVTYSGSTERWSAGERKRRGCTLLDLDTGALQRLELDTRRFLFLEEPDDPLREFEAHARQLQDAVVVLRTGADQTPRKLEAEGQRRGALYVIVRRADRDEDDDAGLALMEQLTSTEQLQSVVSAAVEGQNFSELAREIDEVVRDANVPDSRVDEQTGELLAGSGL